MKKEYRVNVPVNFGEKDTLLISFVEFYKSVAVACETTVANLEQLKKEHKENIQSIEMTKLVGTNQSFNKELEEPAILLIPTIVQANKSVEAQVKQVFEIFGCL
ncbi:hypothetical protein MFLAVUS_010004 [Mucor flavus]|uniref:Uncharacterized protein n=1 Tax=Mucor flavus TaxID=439312 RepID=A0ABP9ZBK4_9FUNG